MQVYYEEDILDGRLKDFRFQRRVGSLNMRAISRTDVSQIIHRKDLAALDELVKKTNIINADVLGEDFDFLSPDLLVKLFQICQLSLDVAYTKNTMLEKEINEINRRFERSERNLRRQDEEVAMLRDELYHYREASKKVTEQPKLSPTVSRIDHSLFPSQERRVVVSAEPLGEDYTVSKQTSAEIKLHIVSPSHGSYLPLTVDESCTILSLHAKIAEDIERNFLFEEEWCLYFKGQEVESTGTLKDYQIIEDSALIILPTSSNTMDSKLDDIKSILNQVTNTLQCQAVVQESYTDPLTREESIDNDLPEEVQQIETVQCIDDVTSNLSSSAETSGDDDIGHEGRTDSDKNNDNIEFNKKTPTTNMGLKIDATECNKEFEEWPFGLNFIENNANAGPPREISIVENSGCSSSPSITTLNEHTPEPMGIANSPPKFSFCDCLGDEVCDECVDVSSPRSSKAVASCHTKKNKVDEQFTFSSFDNIESENFMNTDYDFSCDKSDRETFKIGAKESNNIVTDTDLQSIDIEMSLQEFASELELKAIENEHEKKATMKTKSNILKKMTFKPKFKFINKKRLRAIKLE